MTGFLRHTLIYLSLLLPVFGIAQVQFQANTDARQIVLGGSFSVDFILSNADGSDFAPPKFNGFDILSGPNESRSMTINNGKRSQSYGLSYVLQPRKIGRYTIGAATVKVDGKTLRTRPFQVEVLKGKNSTASTKQELDKELSEGIFLKAILNTEDSKVGQQIIIDYKLFTSKNIESFNLSAESEYPGFFVHEMRRYNGQQLQEVIDGVQYTTKVIKRVSLFPQQSGTFIIDPLSLNISIAIGSSRPRSIFAPTKVSTFQVATNPIEIKVKPLPENPPNSFSGGVGKFEMRTSINRNRLTTDDAIAIRMYLNGDGDIKQVQAPTLELSDKFKVYAPKLIKESNYEENGILKGNKEFEYQVIPLEPGEYTLSTPFTYFDVDSSKYITINSDNFPIAVKKGELDRTQIIKSDPTIASNKDIRFIKTDMELERGNPFIGSGLFWVLFTFPFLVLGGVIIIRQLEIQKGNIDPLLLKKKKAVKVAQKRMAQGKVYMDGNNSKAFYDEISRASFGYICDKLNIPIAELTKHNVNTKMQSLSISENSINKFMEIVKTCEMALFAGKDNTSAMNETYQHAIEVIAEIEEQIIE